LKEAPVSAAYDGRQFVGIDLHRRRSVVSRTDQHGNVLEAVRISNDPHMLAEVMGRAGEQPEVVLEATYGWYWAADLLATIGANVHLAHPLGVKAFAYRRVKNDFRDAADLADLLRLGRLPEAWIAPPQVRDLRQLVRHRAKLVAVRTGWKCQVHAVLAACGVPVRMSDLFGEAGTQLLDNLQLPTAFAARINSLRRLLEPLDAEIALFGGMVAARLARHRGYRAIQPIDGLGPVLAAVLVAEIGDISRFPGPAQLASWVGLTPRHRESDTHVHRGKITKQGSRLARWAAVEAVQRIGPRPGWGRSATGSPNAAAATSAWSPPPASLSAWSRTGCATATSAAWPHDPSTPTVGAGRAGHDPHLGWRGRPI
jgi:transposase